MRVLTDKAQPKVRNNNLKAALDFIRSLLNRLEASLVLWGFLFTACAIVLTR